MHNISHTLDLVAKEKKSEHTMLTYQKLSLECNLPHQNERHTLQNT